MNNNISSAIGLVFFIVLGGSLSAQPPSGQLQPDPLSPNRDSWLKAPALQPGDTVAIVAPSSPVNVSQVRTYAKSLEELGYHVVIPQNIERADGYLAGTDKQRADELNAMIRDPQVRAIFPARGGYGLTRILDQLDYEALRRDPKIIAGYSDITALHLAVARHCRLITFHSPVPMKDLWKGDAPEVSYSNALFRRSVFECKYPSDVEGYEIRAPQYRPAETLVSGTAQGRLVGGNLTLIASTMGTPYAVDMRDSILFLEDVDEAPYRIDRMLSQLRLSRDLEKVRGVILGDFSHNDGNTQSDMCRVLREYFGNASVPVVWNFPLGHISDNATLPVGALVELDADQCVVRLLENPVRLRSTGLFEKPLNGR